MSRTPSPAPLILEGHIKTPRRSKLWSILALGLAFNAGMLVDRRACNQKDEAPVVRTPDAKEKEEQEARRKEALELSNKCHIQLLLDTRNQCRKISEAELKRQYWNCENIKPKSDRP